MNRINPLYIALLLVVIIMLLVFKLSGARTDLSDAQTSFKDTTKIATELSSLKKVYAKKINLASLKSASVVQKKSKNTVVLSAKEIDIKELNTLMGKLLNGTYNIRVLKIKKINDTKASLYLEIKW